MSRWRALVVARRSGPDTKIKHISSRGRSRSISTSSGSFDLLSVDQTLETSWLGDHGTARLEVIHRVAVAVVEQGTGGSAAGNWLEQVLGTRRRDGGTIAVVFAPDIRGLGWDKFI